MKIIDRVHPRFLSLEYAKFFPKSMEYMSSFEGDFKHLIYLEIIKLEPNYRSEDPEGYRDRDRELLNGIRSFVEEHQKIKLETHNGKIHFHNLKKNTTTFVEIKTNKQKKRVLVWEGKSLGTIHENGGVIRAKWLRPRQDKMLYIIEGHGIPGFVDAYHETSCVVCNRKLTDPYSSKVGMGPICRKRSGYPEQEKK